MLYFTHLSYPDSLSLRASKKKVSFEAHSRENLVMQILHFSTSFLPVAEVALLSSVTGKLLGFLYLMAKLYSCMWYCCFWQTHTSHSQHEEWELTAGSMS